MAGRRAAIRAAIGLALAGLLASAFPASAAAQTSPWWTGDQDVILGYGCTPIVLEPRDSRFNCPPYASHVHEAMDIDLAYGTPIHAGWPGIVTEVGGREAHDYGPHYVKIWLDEGHDIVLGHLSAAVVVSGQRVEIGTLIGYVGDLGVADIPNLDFSARPHDGGPYQSIDPAPFLSFLDPAEASQSFAARDPHGHVQVLARWQVDGRIWASNPGSLWSAIPGGPSPGFASQPLVRGDGSGRLVALAVGLDGALWTSSQEERLDGSGRWRAWLSLGAPGGAGLAGSPAAGVDLDGSLHVLVGASDGSLWETRQDRPGGAWSGWDANPIGRGFAGDPGLARDSSGALEVVVASLDGSLQVDRQAASGSWSGWVSLGAPAGAGAGAGFSGRPAMVRDASGQVVVFVVTAGGSLFVSTQSADGAGWTPWSSIGCCSDEVVAAVVRRDGRLQLVRLDRSGFLVTAFRQDGSWTAWSRLGSGASGGVAVVLQPDGSPLVITGATADRMVARSGDPANLMAYITEARARALDTAVRLLSRGDAASPPAVV
jgi:hypothetical protein